MRSLAIFFGVLTAAFFGFKIWWHITYPTATWRYKMTVSVETPEGIKTGSAVREVSVRGAPDIEGFMSPSINVRGEAVAVDLEKRGVLFSLLDDDYGYQVLFDSFPSPLSPISVEGIKYYKTSLMVGGKRILKSEKYPTFVMFHDIENPMTVEQVCERSYCEMVQKAAHRITTNFDQLKIKVQEVSIEVTDEPVTWGIEKQLNWLKKINGGYLDGQFAGGGPELSNVLHGGYFQKGDKK